MTFWCKIWYFSIGKKINVKKKSPYRPTLFSLVMIPEDNYFLLFWPDPDRIKIQLLSPDFKLP